MRMILPLLSLGLIGALASADAADRIFVGGVDHILDGKTDRIFADGFGPFCTLGGEVSGLTGNGLVLYLATDAFSESRPVSANGGATRLYTFSYTVPPGTAYVVSITTQPSGQNCTLSNATGTMANIPSDNINATCVAGPANLIWDDGTWDDADWQ
ncbi:MAG: hypothetical protein ABIR16_07745 [Dokdonella sp.]